jgi:hypothetical protein
MEALALIGVLWTLFITVMWLVIGWRAMRAHERCAAAHERLAYAQEQAYKKI